MFYAERRRTSPNMAGVSLVVLLHLGVALTLASGAMRTDRAAPDTPLILLPLAETPTPPKPVEPAPADPLAEPLGFEAVVELPAQPVFDTEPAAPSPDAAPRPVDAAATPSHSGSPVGAPTLSKVQPRHVDRGSRPVYPRESIVLQEQGITRLLVCTDARGRVTDAAVNVSSGHARLDRAAMEWVKRERFTPGRIDGKPAAMCGIAVPFQWRLEDAR